MIFNNKEGDFSFIEDIILRAALEHDYKIIIENNLQNYFINNMFSENQTLYLLQINRYNWYPLYNRKYLFISLKIIQDILTIGWDKYVELRD